MANLITMVLLTALLVPTPVLAQSADTEAQRDADPVEAAALKALVVASQRHRRDEARKHRFVTLSQRLQGRPIPAALSAELRVHARRVARLLRVRALATIEAPELVERVDALLSIENARHERRVQQLAVPVRPKPAAPDPDDEVEQ